MCIIIFLALCAAQSARALYFLTIKETNNKHAPQLDKKGKMMGAGEMENKRPKRNMSREFLIQSAVYMCRAQEGKVQQAEPSVSQTIHHPHAHSE